MDSNYSGRFLGVLGGMGPMASAAFMARLTALASVESEQQHVPAMLWSDPRVPDRPSGYLGNGPDPLPWMQNGLKHLVQAGAQTIVVPCNTAHLWYEQMAASISVPILHIVQAVIDDLRRNGIHQGRIGLLGTAVTLRLALYQRMLETNGYECVMLADEDLASYCTTAILQVKANRLAEAYAPARHCIDLLRHRRVDAIVLGCTELPLAVPHDIRPELGVVITDSIDALALAAIDWHAG